MRFLTPLIVSFSLFAFAAYAADDAKKGTSSSAAKPTTSSQSSKARFDKLDTNHDGKLSRAEFEAMNKASAGASSSKSSKAAK